MTPTESPQALGFTDQVVHGIKSRQVAIFVGAGVSRPSGLPLAHEIIEKAVHEISSQSSLPQHALAQLTNRAPKELRLEVFLRILVEVAGERGFAPLRLLAGGIPSHTHRFIAACLRSGLVETAVTTNFDTLIEEACKDAQIEFQLLAHPTEYSAESNRHVPKIAKIHGSLVSKSGLPRPGILADVRQIGQGLGHERLHFLRTLLARKHILVLGYSGRDYFGAMPVIFTSTGPAIFWVSHKNGSGGMDRHIQEWLSKSQRGVVIQANTDSWLSQLGEKLGLNMYPHEAQQERVACNGLTSMKGFLSRNEANLIGTMILGRLNCTETAAECFKITIETCEKQTEQNEELMTRAFLEAGRHTLKTGGNEFFRHQLAHGIFSRAYELSESFPELRLEAEISLLDMQFCMEYLAGRTPAEYTLHAQSAYDATIEYLDPVLTARACSLMGRVLLNCVEGQLLSAMTSSDMFEECVHNLEHAGAQDLLGPLYLTLVKLYGRTGQKSLFAKASLKFLRSQLLCSCSTSSPAVEYGRHIVNQIVGDTELNSNVLEETKEGAARLGIQVG
jgi:hypothetical protein